MNSLTPAERQACVKLKIAIEEFERASTEAQPADSLLTTPEGLFTAIVTHERRASELAVTAPQFAWLEPVTFKGVGAPSPIANRANFQAAIKAAWNAGGDALLLEDDIDASPDFPAALAAARSYLRPVTFWLSKGANHPADWQAFIRSGVGQPAQGFHPVRRMNMWFGSQALYLPRRTLRVMVQSPAFTQSGSEPFDVWYRHWARDTGNAPLVALPNPIEHRSPETLVDPDRVARVSATYHLPRGDWRECAVRQEQVDAERHDEPRLGGGLDEVPAA